MKLSRSSLGAILTIKKTGRGKTAMYYLTRVTTAYGFTLEEVMEANYNKLINRKRPIGLRAS